MLLTEAEAKTKECRVMPPVVQMTREHVVTTPHRGRRSMPLASASARMIITSILEVAWRCGTSSERN